MGADDAVDVVARSGDSADAKLMLLLIINAPSAQHNIK